MDLYKEFDDFQKKHLIRQLIINNKRWKFIDTEKGKETILMIHGGMGSSESNFRYISSLENDFRIISLTIPEEINTIEGAINGILAILKTKKLKKFHGIGFSMGGMIEQVLLRKNPEYFKSIILFHCPPPSKSYANFINKTFKLSQFISFLLPLTIAKRIKKVFINRNFAKEYPDVPKEERDFWADFYTDRTSKTRNDNQIKIVLDYLLNYNFTPDDLSKWKGKSFIFETATDSVIPKADREYLKQLYPKAKVYTFSKGSHLGNGLFQLKTVIPLIRKVLTWPSVLQN